MRFKQTLRPVLLAGLVFGALLSVGCFESEYPLGPRQDGRVDLRYIGDWLLESTDGQGQVETTRLVVRNLHNNEYYAEWITDDGTAWRSTAHLTEIDGVNFVNMLPLTDDGKIAEKYMIMRVDFDGTKMTLRNLSSDFFKQQTFNSSQELRKLVQQNLNNEKMYADEPMFGTKEMK